ncbi:MAG: asparagine synthase-related protein [Patescibacteria group bacterium]
MFGDINWDLKDVLKLPVVSGVDDEWCLGELAGVLEQAQQAAAEECMWRNSDGAVHICLSGGLDSTLGLAFVRRAFPETRIVAHTIAISDGHADLVHAKLAAKAFGVEHRIVVPAQMELDEMLERGKLRSAGVHLLYDALEYESVRCVIAHDGIDELMGGYWGHRAFVDPVLKRGEFELHWDRLFSDHLEQLQSVASRAGVVVVLPYLVREVVEYIARIPLNERTDRAESKKPLRSLARMLGVPQEIVARQKLGFCDAMVANERTTGVAVAR